MPNRIGLVVGAGPVLFLGTRLLSRHVLAERCLTSQDELPLAYDKFHDTDAAVVGEREGRVDGVDVDQEVHDAAH